MTYRSHPPTVALSALLALVPLTACSDLVVAPSATDSTAVVRTDPPPPPTASDWTSLAPMPEARWGLSAAALDGIVYVAGGVVGAGNGAHPSEIMAYDPTTNGWRTVGRLPHGVRSPAMAAVNDRLYVLGGFRDDPGEVITLLQIFDPATGTVEAGPPMPSRRGGLAVAVLDGRIHAIGGMMDDADDPMGVDVGTHEVFDTRTGVWSRLAPLPMYNVVHGAAAVGGKIYVATGPQARMYVYDPATDSWSVASSASPSEGPWFYRTVAAVKGKIYLLGGGQSPPGCCSGPTPRSTVERFDPETGIWELVAPMPTPRHFAAAAATEDAVYVIGGSVTGPSLSAGTANERFAPE